MSNNSTTTPENHFLPVIVTLVDGDTLKGDVSIPHGKSLGDVLNGKDLFILFRVKDGELIYLAQQTIAAVQSNKIPDAPQLEQALYEADHAAAHDILNIKKEASRPEARDAYHALVKQYHPDQFSNMNLPSEVQDYFEAVILRLNAAYKEFLDEAERLEKRRRAEALRAQQQKSAANGISYFGQ